MTYSVGSASHTIAKLAALGLTIDEVKAILG